MASYSLGCDALDHIGQRRALPRLHFHETTDSVGDLLPSPVPNCNRQRHQIVLRSRHLGRRNRGHTRLRSEVEAADSLYPYAFWVGEGATSMGRDLGIGRGKISRNLRLRPLEVL